MDSNLAWLGQMSPLYKLPPELQCEIYEKVLISNRPLELNPSYLQNPLLPPALLQT